jgi:hypothetical protein
MVVPIKKFAILGERCSGTNFLEELITHNFNLLYTTEYGSKHFFCFDDYSNKNVEDTLFIGIIRNPIYWLNSFSKEQYHVPEHNRKNLTTFLFNEFYSVHDEIDTTIQPQDSNIFTMNNKFYTHKYKLNYNDLNYTTGKKYKNIFELRKLKNDFLIKIMQTKVDNYILVNYEDLLYNMEITLNNIKKQFNLIQRNSAFVSVQKYKKTDTYNFVMQRQITFTPDIVKMIWNNLDVNQENNLGYFMGNNNHYFKNKITYILDKAESMPLIEGECLHSTGQEPVIPL